MPVTVNWGWLSVLFYKAENRPLFHRVSESDDNSKNEALKALAKGTCQIILHLGNYCVAYLAHPIA